MQSKDKGMNRMQSKDKGMNRMQRTLKLNLGASIQTHKFLKRRMSELQILK